MPHNIIVAGPWSHSGTYEIVYMISFACHMITYDYDVICIMLYERTCSLSFHQRSRVQDIRALAESELPAIDD
jgi:hypothetical protein